MDNDAEARCAGLSANSVLALAETSVRTEVRRKRKVTLATALKAATRAGRNVASAVIEDGKIELKFGDGEHEAPSNPWDKVLRHDTH